MKTGIIGLPQVGKTSLFDPHEGARRMPCIARRARRDRQGSRRAPGRLSLFKPKKTTHATVEYVDAHRPEALRVGLRAATAGMESLTHAAR
jgi:hypothetical protein